LDSTIGSIIDEHTALIRQIEHTVAPRIERAAQWIMECLSGGNKILFAGNGGSAADAQHFAAEFVGRFRIERVSLPAIALTTDTSVLTAVGNDYGFDKIFSRQLEGLVRRGDIFVAISTSGNSKNVVEAVEVCRKKSCRTVGLLGKDGGTLAGMVDLPIIIESNNTARVQEVHITIGHIICELVEEALFR